MYETLEGARESKFKQALNTSHPTLFEYVVHTQVPAPRAITVPYKPSYFWVLLKAKKKKVLHPRLETTFIDHLLPFFFFLFFLFCSPSLTPPPLLIFPAFNVPSFFPSPQIFSPSFLSIPSHSKSFYSHFWVSISVLINVKKKVSHICKCLMDFISNDTVCTWGTIYSTDFSMSDYVIFTFCMSLQQGTCSLFLPISTRTAWQPSSVPHTPITSSFPQHLKLQQGSPRALHPGLLQRALRSALLLPSFLPLASLSPALSLSLITVGSRRL